MIKDFPFKEVFDTETEAFLWASQRVGLVEIPQELVNYAQSLVEDVNLDLNESLNDDNE
jgi:hypothetical protein